MFINFLLCLIKIKTEGQKNKKGYTSFFFFFSPLGRERKKNQKLSREGKAMANYSLVLEDNGIIGFYPIRNAGEVKSNEDVERLFDEAMRNSNNYKTREVWDRPALIGIVKGIVNWYDARLGNDMEYTKQKYASR